MVASAVDFGLTLLLAEVVGLWYVLATFLGAVCGGVVNCCINYRWVFSARRKGKWSLLMRYAMVWGLSIVFNTLLVFLLTEWSSLSYILVKVVVACMVAVAWNYPMQRRFVFDHADKEYIENEL